MCDLALDLVLQLTRPSSWNAQEQQSDSVSVYQQPLNKDPLRRQLLSKEAPQMQPFSSMLPKASSPFLMPLRLA